MHFIANKPIYFNEILWGFFSNRTCYRMFSEVHYLFIFFEHLHSVIYFYAWWYYNFYFPLSIS